MMRSLTVLALALAASLVLSSCSRSDSGSPALDERGRLAPALDAITAPGLLAHISVLASDEFEGRAPGTRGEDLTVAYLEKAFADAGLEPGHPDGTWVQHVPVVGITSSWTGRITVGSKALALDARNDYLAISRRLAPAVRVDESELLFVGYGIEAPEFGWDDYKGVDVTGKTVVMLVGDPPVPDPADPARLDAAMFRGRALTYYGRWTYKYEQAGARGAAAAILVHETGPVGFPWGVVMGSWSLENFELRRSDGNASRVAVEAWMTEGKTRELMSLAGQDFEALKRAAATRDFRPVALGGRASFEVANTLRDVDTRNVIARLDGSDPVLRSEYVLYTAHWDHVGRDAMLEGDQIYNGAIDNASGVATLIEIGRAFARLPERPKRTTLFAALTTEEKGLLGARYYAQHPPYPLDRTLANINMDGMNQWGPTRDIVVVGMGNTTIDQIAADVAAAHGRVLAPDPEPEKGYFYRSDHFELAKQGVPAFYTGAGTEYIGKPEGYGLRKRQEYVANDYHKVTDEVKPDWDLAGAADDTRFLFEVGHRIAQAAAWPEWKPGTEFRAAREAMLRPK